MKREIDYKITLEEAKKIAESYCKQKGYSYEKLLTSETYYSAPMPTREDCWLWYKQYDGPKDPDWFGLDRYMPYQILAVKFDGSVIEGKDIDLIKP